MTRDERQNQKALLELLVETAEGYERATSNCTGRLHSMLRGLLTVVSRLDVLRTFCLRQRRRRWKPRLTRSRVWLQRASLYGQALLRGPVSSNQPRSTNQQ
jgi:hypothetical protein